MEHDAKWLRYMMNGPSQNPDREAPSQVVSRRLARNGDLTELRDNLVVRQKSLLAVSSTQRVSVYLACLKRPISGSLSGGRTRCGRVSETPGVSGDTDKVDVQSPKSTCRDVGLAAEGYAATESLAGSLPTGQEARREAIASIAVIAWWRVLTSSCRRAVRPFPRASCKRRRSTTPTGSSSVTDTGTAR